MKINQVCLVPRTAGGGMGRTVDTTSEEEIIRLYSRHLYELLCEYGIRTFVLSGGVKIPDTKPMDSIQPATLAIQLGAGWFDPARKTRKWNCSEVYYSGREALDLAEVVSVTLADWGTCCAWGHRGGGPKQRDLPLLAGGSAGLLLEPFSMNGPEYAVYASRLAHLGRDLGMALADWLRPKNHAVAWKPASAAGACRF